MITVGGFTFHWYGLIVGIALILGWTLIEYRFKKIRSELVSLSDLELMIGVGILAGFVGARLWHVATDWSLYQNNPLAILYVWQGGLSIIGAVVFGIGAVTLFNWFRNKKKWQDISWFFFDLVVFGLPIAQAVGRLGNWVNQELYGQPTTLPWAIFIRPEARLVGYQHFEYFHPLFAYEATAMLIFGLLVWWKWDDAKLNKHVGTLSLLYLSYYSLVRFGLEFLRLDKTMLGYSELGVNQFIMLIVFMLSGGWLLKKYRFDSR